MPALLGDNEHHIHTQTHGDHRDSINQTHNDEELGTQQRQQIRLTRSAFEELTTQHTDTDGSTTHAQIDVNIVDDVPKANADTASVTEGGVVTGNVLANDVGGADGPTSIFIR